MDYNIVVQLTGMHTSNGLCRLLSMYDVKTIIEVGSWLASSAIIAARMLPDDGKVIAVDDLSSVGDQSVASNLGIPMELGLQERQARSNIIHQQISHKVELFKGDSVEFATGYLQKNGIKGDLIYLDSGHFRDEVWEEIEVYLPLLKGPRILCGDDYNLCFAGFDC